MGLGAFGGVELAPAAGGDGAADDLAGVGGDVLDAAAADLACGGGFGDVTDGGGVRFGGLRARAGGGGQGGGAGDAEQAEAALDDDAAGGGLGGLVRHWGLPVGYAIEMYDDGKIATDQGAGKRRVEGAVRVWRGSVDSRFRGNDG